IPHRVCGFTKCTSRDDQPSTGRACSTVDRGRSKGNITVLQIKPPLLGQPFKSPRLKPMRRTACFTFVVRATHGQSRLPDRENRSEAQTIASRTHWSTPRFKTSCQIRFKSDFRMRECIQHP
ncbi:unnamed protein product, partial [Ectocarpus fasciculatus]